MKKLIGLCLLCVGIVAACGLPPVEVAAQVRADFSDPPAAPPVPAPAAAAIKIKKVFVPAINRVVIFRHRDQMKPKVPNKRAYIAQAAIPATTLPVDSTGNQTVVCPMDGNDTLGDCGEAMVCHADNILTFGQGKSGFTESTFALKALESQYEQISGGDNGMDEDMVVGPQGAWTVGIAGNKAAVCVDHLDIDVTNVAMTQYCIDQFYTVEMAWSVPDAFITNFKTGVTFDVPATPDPANGHFVPLSDVAANGNYTIWTWGTYCFATPAFIGAVQPQCFVTFSPRQFNLTTGLDSKGRHITAQAAKWAAMGGTAIASSVINAFPPLAAPTPVNPPTPVTPTPTPAASGLTIQDTAGNQFTLPSGYTVATTAPTPLSGSFVLNAISNSMSSAEVIAVTTSDKTGKFEQQRQQVLALVNKAKASPDIARLNFGALLTALASLVNDMLSGNWANVGADFEALITALTAAPGKK